MSNSATQGNLDKVIDQIEALGYKADVEKGQFTNVVAVIGDTRSGGKETLEGLDGVERVIPIMKPYKHVSREFRKENTVIELPNGTKIGDNKITMMVGPCAVEDQVMSEADVEMCVEYADILQIGARTMHAFRLLKEVGKTRKPVLLKRGFHATIREWLLSAEYIISEGNWNVILCERGIRTFDDEFSRNVLDLTAVQILKKESHLPVIVDPSHGTGQRDLVVPMSKAAIAAGADGLIIEAHPNPSKALSDGPQSLPVEELPALRKELEEVVTAMGRTI